MVLLVLCLGGCSHSEQVAYRSAPVPPVPTFTIGGTVTGLAGTGLTLQLNGGANLGVSGNAFAFPVSLTSGSSYTVTVLAQPTNVSQTCIVAANGSGTIAAASVANVAISCTTNGFSVGGTVDVVTGTGLVLQNNGGNNLAVGASGPFTFGAAILSGASYNVTVLSQPSGQTCVVTNAAGTVEAANVTNVALKCSFSLAGLNDPLVLQQWHLKNTGQTAFADVGGVSGMDINVEPVFGLGVTGSNVTVAVVDTGIEIAHEDLAANVVPGGSWNFNTSTTDPTNTIDTTGDHGTSVAGLIGMAVDNGKGGIGVAPHARLKGFNFLSMTVPTEQAFLDSLGASNASPNSSDVFVFNQSFGVPTITPIAVDPTDESQYLSGVTSLRGGKGALYVKAAGNGFDVAGDPTNPSNSVDCTGTGLTCENANFDPTNTLPYQIVVGAINANGIKASYSTAGSAIWVSAPGGEFGFNASVLPGQPANEYQPAMVTADQSGCTKGFSRTGVNTSVFNNGGAPNTSCNYTNRMNGTSSATPVTAGVIALMLEANPGLTWRDIKHIIASTARKIDATGGAVNGPLAGYVAEPGWIVNQAPASQFSPNPFNYHNWYGFGLVDASAAVSMAKTYSLNIGTYANTGFVSSGVLSLAIPDASATGVTSSVTVPSGAVQVVEEVQVRVSITHPFLGDLGIEVISPSGTRSVVKNIEDGYADAANLQNQVFLSNAFYGENAVGTWTIKVVDALPGETGTLTNWDVRVYGH